MIGRGHTSTAPRRKSVAQKRSGNERGRTSTARQPPAYVQSMKQVRARGQTNRPGSCLLKRRGLSCGGLIERGVSIYFRLLLRLGAGGSRDRRPRWVSRAVRPSVGFAPSSGCSPLVLRRRWRRERQVDEPDLDRYPPLRDSDRRAQIHPSAGAALAMPTQPTDSREPPGLLRLVQLALIRRGRRR